MMCQCHCRHHCCLLDGFRMALLDLSRTRDSFLDQVESLALKLNLPKCHHPETPHGCNRRPSLCCILQCSELYHTLSLNLPLLLVIRLLICTVEIKAMVKVFREGTEGSAGKLDTFLSSRQATGPFNSVGAESNHPPSSVHAHPAVSEVM